MGILFSQENRKKLEDTGIGHIDARLLNFYIINNPNNSYFYQFLNRLFRTYVQCIKIYLPE